jgi:hypothetical protein
VRGGLDDSRQSKVCQTCTQAAVGGAVAGGLRLDLNGRFYRFSNPILRVAKIGLGSEALYLRRGQGRHSPCSSLDPQSGILLLIAVGQGARLVIRELKLRFCCGGGRQRALRWVQHRRHRATPAIGAQRSCICAPPTAAAPCPSPTGPVDDDVPRAELVLERCSGRRGPRAAGRPGRAKPCAAPPARAAAAAAPRRRTLQRCLWRPPRGREGARRRRRAAGRGCVGEPSA